MPFCPSCGSEVAGAFCAKCGSAVAGAAPSGGAGYPPPNPPAGGPPPGAGYPPQGGYPPQPAAAGLDDNIAALLCYLAGFITGIIFLVIEPYNKKPKIRFHAFQSIFISVGMIVFQIVFSIVVGILMHLLGLYFVASMLGLLLWLAWLLLWLYMMFSAYQGKTVVLPIIGPIAQKQAGN